MFFVEGAYDFVDVRDVADGMIAARSLDEREKATSWVATASPSATCSRPCVK